MRVSKENVMKAVENRLKDGEGNVTASNVQIENLVAQVQSVLDVTEDRPGWSACQIHSIASSAARIQNYEDNKKPR